MYECACLHFPFQIIQFRKCRNWKHKKQIPGQFLRIVSIFTDLQKASQTKLYNGQILQLTVFRCSLFIIKRIFVDITKVNNYEPITSHEQQTELSMPIKVFMMIETQMTTITMIYFLSTKLLRLDYQF